MRFLGEQLHAEGYAVRGVRLPGHATLGPTLYEAGWRDWYAEALHGLEDLARLSPTVVVIGLSMGSLLALRLAAERSDDRAAYTRGKRTFIDRVTEEAKRQAGRA